MRSINLALAVLAAMLLAGITACRPVLETRPLDNVDRKLSTYTYIEEGNLVSLIADARSTRWRENAPYIPLEICVANRGLKRLTITRESFTLVDSQGNRYPCADPTELLDAYEYLEMDRNLSELPGIIYNRFSTYTRYESQFSPLRRSAGPFTSTLVKDRVTLPKFGYLVDFIYFPRPKTGVMNQRFELFMTTSELPDPVFVRFIVR